MEESRFEAAVNETDEKGVDFSATIWKFLEIFLEGSAFGHHDHSRLRSIEGGSQENNLVDRDDE